MIIDITFNSDLNQHAEHGVKLKLESDVRSRFSLTVPSNRKHGYS